MNNKKKRNAKTLPTFKRLLGYILRNYKLQVVAVVALILISALANIAGTLFMKNLIDNYIVASDSIKIGEFDDYFLNSQSLCRKMEC